MRSIKNNYLHFVQRCSADASNKNLHKYNMCIILNLLCVYNRLFIKFT